MRQGSIINMGVPNLDIHIAKGIYNGWPGWKGIVTVK